MEVIFPFIIVGHVSQLLQANLTNKSICPRTQYEAMYYVLMKISILRYQAMTFRYYKTYTFLEQFIQNTKSLQKNPNASPFGLHFY